MQRESKFNVFDSYFLTPLSKLTAALLILTAPSAIVMAQTETAQITGTVTDIAGGLIGGANVSARSIGTGVTRSVKTSSEGSYTITNLLPGEYTVTVSSTGFATTERRLILSVG